VVGASRGNRTRTVALQLAASGSTVCLVGRCRDTLGGRGGASSTGRFFCLSDLGEEAAVRKVAHDVGQRVGGADLLVHCAGAYARGTIREASVDQFDLLYKVNVRGPYLLTQLLLPLLTASRGQIVFVNSTQGLDAGATVGQYAATQHGLAIADSLRHELNAEGVRVLSVFPGRTATPRMHDICRAENRAYQPELLLQPSDIAAVIVNAITLPRTAEVTNINIRPFVKSY
jgi:NADP-dependent 3-hydroxy acid dehydrogenase YdfG